MLQLARFQRELCSSFRTYWCYGGLLSAHASLSSGRRVFIHYLEARWIATLRCSRRDLRDSRSQIRRGGSGARTCRRCTVVGRHASRDSRRGNPPRRRTRKSLRTLCLGHHAQSCSHSDSAEVGPAEDYSVLERTKRSRSKSSSKANGSLLGARVLRPLRERQAGVRQDCELHRAQSRLGGARCKRTRLALF
jgi:hypothetical protein